MSDEKDDLRKRKKRFALRIISLYDSLSRFSFAQVLGHQLLRSGTSVGANFREAHRARSNAKFISKVGDSPKELEETAYRLEPLVESGKIAKKKLALLIDETSRLTAILTAIVKSCAVASEFILHPSTLILLSWQPLRPAI
jgi:four helix bundle protein